MKQPLDHPHLAFLAQALRQEENAQKAKYHADEPTALSELKKDGLALHPVRVIQRRFGFADYPEIVISIPISQSTDLFKNGGNVEVFMEHETSVPGILLQIDGQTAEVRLVAPDFPEWLEEKGVGIRISPDTKTLDICQDTLQWINQHPTEGRSKFFHYVHDGRPIPQSIEAIHYQRTNNSLNESQHRAIESALSNKPLHVIHGPPGTGKTTTLVALIDALVKAGKRILVTAPSNTAVDHLAHKLIEQNITMLRVGNQTKVDERLLPFTIDGKLEASGEAKQLKKWRIQAEELRKMANQYKRNFGKEEREQRKRLLQEVKNIRKEIRSWQSYQTQKLVEQASVICGTPVALYDAPIQHLTWDACIVDEAGQCLEVLGWVALRDTDRLIVAGDPHQLPPTILEPTLMQTAFSESFLDHCLRRVETAYLLDTQYRMKSPIVAFSNTYFYEDKLQTPPLLTSTEKHVFFYDTAGTGFEEEKTDEGTISNPGELTLIRPWMEEHGISAEQCAVISPYAGQVSRAKQVLGNALRISTIDSFQGQEQHTILLSLVRSNDRGEIGFLKDYRRMNVALTRAKENLVVIGDSSTLGNDPFFGQWLQHMEATGNYHSAWELMV